MTTARKLPIILGEFIIYPQSNKGKTGGCEHVTGWTCKYEDLNRLLMPKNLPDHCSQVCHRRGCQAPPQM